MTDLPQSTSLTLMVTTLVPLLFCFIRLLQVVDNLPHILWYIKPWFNDDCRLAFDIKQGAHLRWNRDLSRVNWDAFVHYQRRANAVCAEAMRQFSVRSRDVLMKQCPHKWWFTLKGIMPFLDVLWVITIVIDSDRGHC